MMRAKTLAPRLSKMPVLNWQSGEGAYTWSSGEVYIGGWQRGLEHGNGVKNFSDGSRYDGSGRPCTFASIRIRDTSAHI